METILAPHRQNQILTLKQLPPDNLTVLSTLMLHRGFFSNKQPEKYRNRLFVAVLDICYSEIEKPKL
jgi:hypothetical protein